MWSLVLLSIVAAVVAWGSRARRLSGVPPARADLAIACAIGCAVAGGLDLVRLMFSYSRWTIDGVPLAGAASVGGAALLVVLLWSARGRVARGKRAAWIALATFGALSFCLALTRDLNIDLDFARAAPREARVLNITSSTTLRGGTLHYLRLEDWTNEGAARELDVSRTLSRSYGIGQRVAFEEHPGAFGFRWIGNLRAAPVSGRAEAPATAGPVPAR